MFSMKPTFKDTVHYLYQRVPSFQQIGAKAYKPDLANIKALLEVLGNPQRDLKCIHVAGTNGKGSCSSMLASILTSAGYKTGLYTSPHLKSFTERIRIDGTPIDEGAVVDFVEKIKITIEEIQPSFFEVTTALAFDYFKKTKTEINVIEVGLGGRLDSTNVISPVVSLITNIGHDHLDLLGPGLKEVAMEKAGIIKVNIPVVISERQSFSSSIFTERANSLQATILFAEDVENANWTERGLEIDFQNQVITLEPYLKGWYQLKNIKGVMSVIRELISQGWDISANDVKNGLEAVGKLSGLKGRWQKIGSNPDIICDTAHNPEGIAEIVKQLRQMQFQKLFWVIGMVSDKDHLMVLKLLPTDAHYYFCQAKISRTLNASDLKIAASKFGLKGEVVMDVNEALKVAREAANKNDLILVCGSSYIVAELKQI